MLYKILDTSETDSFVLLPSFQEKKYISFYHFISCCFDFRALKQIELSNFF
jgi:hypothetical protein